MTKKNVWHDDQQHIDDMLRACPTCNGRGLQSHPDAAEQEDCETCRGTGFDFRYTQRYTRY
jgi:DnaJ-class molecular chaperone